MKNLRFLSMMMAAGILLSCSTDDGWEEYGDVNNGQSVPGGAVTGGDATTGSALTGTLATFDVVINTESLDETETLPSSSDTYYEDYVETFTPTATLQIAFNGNSATVVGEVDGVTVSTQGAHVTVNSTVKNVAYELSGSTTDGSFKIYSEKKFELILNGVSLTNPA